MHPLAEILKYDGYLSTVVMEMKLAASRYDREAVLSALDDIARYAMKIQEYAEQASSTLKEELEK